MKKIITKIISIILILILIFSLAIFGMIVYVQINKEDVVVSEFLNKGYNLINNTLFNGKLGKQEEQEYDVKSLEEIVGDSENLQKYYYYGQLNEYSKIIYNELLENKENMKTGTYQINFKKVFSDLLEQPNGQEELRQCYQSAIETFLYDNPDVFYLDVTKMYISIQTTKNILKTEYEVTLGNSNKTSYLRDGYETKEQIEIAEKQIQEIKNEIIEKIKNKTDYEKIKEIHDYLVDNITYEETISKNGIYDIYGALVNKECVCEGYAKAYKYLLDEANIENVMVIGVGINSDNEKENHAWNYVKLKGKWYAVDTTWDDPVVIGGGKVSSISKYKFFLLGEQEISKDHTLSYQFTEGGKEYIYPELSETKYNITTLKD